MLENFKHAETTIPNKILLDPNLTDVEVRVYLVIKMLSYKDGYCWATNHQLSDFIGKSFDSVNMALRRLKKKKYIVINTDQKRSPKRKIFTMQAWSELVYTDKVPKDCESSIQLPIAYINYTRDMSFKEFKEFVTKYYSNLMFNLQPGNKLGYRADILFRITKTGYLENTFTGDLVDKETAHKIWEYLFERKDAVLDYFKKKQGMK